MFTFLTMSSLVSNMKICILCVLLACLSCLAQTNGQQRCDLETLNSRTKVLSTRYLNFSSGPYCKYWSIHGEPNMTVTISFSTIDLQRRCDLNFVKIGPDPQVTLCQYNFTRPYIAKIRTEHVWVQFKTDNVMYNRVEFRFSRGYQPSPWPCYTNEIRCGNMKCIPKEWQCNGRDECGDNSDENECNQDSGSRQSHCGWEYVCDNAHCVPHSVLCNNINDCGDNSDERDCNGNVVRTTRSYPSFPDMLTTLSPTDVSRACKHTYLERTTGYFTSPNYPHRYPANCVATWSMQSPNRNDRIQLHFQNVQLQAEPHTDYIAVYDGLDERSRLIGQYYGGYLPPKWLESTGSALFVEFHSDSWNQLSGFYARFKIKGECLSDQNKCDGENYCYFKYEQCNGIWDCPLHGSDELGCRHCKRDEYSCGTSSKCYRDTERCNGKSFCLNNADEYNCTADRCNEDKGLFLCRNKRCIYQSWECDRTSDCEDHSDEQDCPSPFFTRRVLVAAVAGSLICSLLLVIALGCICKVYALRMHEQCSPRHESPLSRLQAEIFRRRAPPPPYHEAMLTSRPYEEARREYLSQSRDNRRRRSSDRRRNRPLPPTPEEPTMHQLADVEAGGDDVQLLSLNSTNHGVNSEASSTTELINPISSSDSEDNSDNNAFDEASDDSDDSVLLDLTENEGGTATWRSVSRQASDEERSPGRIPSEGGCDSVDSASACLSVDEVSLSLHDALDKDNGVEAEIVDKDGSVDPEIPATSSAVTSAPDDQLNNLELIKNQ